jgi:hypothetical protein
VLTATLMAMTDQVPTSPPPPSATATAAGWYLDGGSRQNRWWDGTKWTENFQPIATLTTSNGVAVASLVLGIFGFCLMAIPLFIGWFLGGIPDLLAVIFGIVGLTNAPAKLGVGRGPAITGIVLAGVSLISVFLGAGSLW